MMEVMSSWGYEVIKLPLVAHNILNVHEVMFFSLEFRGYEVIKLPLVAHNILNVH